MTLTQAAEQVRKTQQDLVLAAEGVRAARANLKAEENKERLARNDVLNAQELLITVAIDGQAP